jgi:hypothetical protein
MSQATISMSKASTGAQWSSTYIAMEYGSSPVEQQSDAMRIRRLGLRVATSSSMPRTRHWNWYSSRKKYVSFTVSRLISVCSSSSAEPHRSSVR